VDFGETFPTAAVRECREEAGLNMKLEGLMRFDYAFGRMRAIFAGRPVDEESPLKTIPDEESKGAEWVTTEELATRRLRSKEALRIFQWVERGAPVYPLSILRGRDGPEIDSSKVLTNLYYEVAAVVMNPQRPGCVLLQHSADDMWRLPRFPLRGPFPLEEAAKFVLSTQRQSLPTTSELEMMPAARLIAFLKTLGQTAESNNRLELVMIAKQAVQALPPDPLEVQVLGLLEIFHQPPNSKEDVGRFRAAFATILPNGVEVPANEFSWVAIPDEDKDDAENISIAKSARRLARQARRPNCVYPVSILQLEGAPYDVVDEQTPDADRCVCS
jgi:hypothetical protein